MPEKKNGIVKLKKGSQEAKDYMAKMRAKRGVRRTSHTSDKKKKNNDNKEKEIKK